MDALIKRSRSLLLPAVGIASLLSLIWMARTPASASVRPPASAAGPAVHDSLTAEGRVSSYPGSEVVVSSDRAGTIREIRVEEKQHVKKGDLIASIKSDDLEAAMAESRARVDEAGADTRLYEAEVRRADELWRGEVGSRQALDKASRDLEAARARKRTSIAVVARLQAELDKTRILSPIDGVVVARRVNAGETIDARDAIVTIADLSRTRVEAEVDEFDATRMTLGLPVTISADGIDGQSWRGKIEEIPDTVVSRRLKPEDPGRPTDTRVLLVKVAFDGPTPLKLGQRVAVKIGQ